MKKLWNKYKYFIGDAVGAIALFLIPIGLLWLTLIFE